MCREYVGLENPNLFGTLVPAAGTLVSGIVPDPGLVVSAVLVLVVSREGR